MIPFAFFFFFNEIRHEHEIRLYARKDLGYGMQKSWGIGQWNENLSNLK